MAEAIQDIYDQITTRLDSLVTSGVLKQTFGYPLDQFDKIKNYPCAIYFSQNNNDSEFYTNCAHLRAYNFAVVILDHVKNKKINEMYRPFLGVIDQVMNEFDRNGTLSGATLKIDPVLGNVDTRKVSTDLEIIFAPIEVKCYKEVSIK